MCTLIEKIYAVDESTYACLMTPTMWPTLCPWPTLTRAVPSSVRPVLACGLRRARAASQARGSLNKHSSVAHNHSLTSLGAAAAP